MKNSVLIAVVLVLALPCFASAGALDGLWFSPDISSFAFMFRENFTSVVMVALYLPVMGDDFYYCAVSGMDGIVINFESLDFCGLDISWTMTLISETSATMKTNHCFSRYGGWPCVFPSSFTIEKAF